MPFQGGSSQVLISCRDFDSSICDWKNKFSLLGKYHNHLFRIESFSSRFPMRPSSPIPQGLRPARHPSKFPPRRERVRGTIQVKLAFQIDGFGTDLSQGYQNHFHQKPFSSKTTFIKNHFHQKTPNPKDLNPTELTLNPEP